MRLGITQRTCSVSENVSLTHALTHTHTHTLSLPLSLFLFLFLSLSHSLTPSLSHTYTHLAHRYDEETTLGILLQELAHEQAEAQNKAQRLQKLRELNAQIEARYLPLLFIMLRG